MDVNRLEQQMRFLVEVDKMKSVYRRTILIDKTRRESDAEHSWHFALMAMLLAEYADPEKVDCARVIRMALVHDLIEIYAGDTMCRETRTNGRGRPKRRISSLHCCRRTRQRRFGRYGKSLTQWRRRTPNMRRPLTACSPF